MNDLDHKIIGVIGGSQCTDEDYQIAYEVGKLLAKANVVLVSGGKGGIMEAACKGASEHGGCTIGILPSDSINEANPYVNFPIASGMGIGRNIIIVRTAQVLIAIDGKYGTLSEIAFARQLNKKVIVVRPWIDLPDISIVNSAKEAVELALESLK